MTPPKVEAQDLIDILKQQVANALYEAALNAAIAKGLQKQVEELEAKLNAKDNPPNA